MGKKCAADAAALKDAWTAYVSARQKTCSLQAQLQSQVANGDCGTNADQKNCVSAAGSIQAQAKQAAIDEGKTITNLQDQVKNLKEDALKIADKNLQVLNQTYNEYGKTGPTTRGTGASFIQAKNNLSALMDATKFNQQTPDEAKKAITALRNGESTITGEVTSTLFREPMNIAATANDLSKQLDARQSQLNILTGSLGSNVGTLASAGKTMGGISGGGNGASTVSPASGSDSGFGNIGQYAGLAGAASGLSGLAGGAGGSTGASQQAGYLNPLDSGAGSNLSLAQNNGGGSSVDTSGGSGSGTGASTSNGLGADPTNNVAASTAPGVGSPGTVGSKGGTAVAQGTQFPGANGSSAASAAAEGIYLKGSAKGAGGGMGADGQAAGAAGAGRGAAANGALAANGGGDSGAANAGAGNGAGRNPASSGGSLDLSLGLGGMDSTLGSGNFSLANSDTDKAVKDLVSDFGALGAGGGTEGKGSGSEILSGDSKTLFSRAREAHERALKRGNLIDHGKIRI
jgi:hypothetical protein